AQTMIVCCAVCGGIWVQAAAQARIAAGVRGNAAQERLGKALLAVDDDLRRQRQSVGELKEHTRPGVALRWLAFRIMLPLGDTVRLHRRPHAVYAIIALNVVAFVLELGAHERIGGAFVRWGLRPAVLLGGGHGWTLLTHQFLHAGLGHLAGNMLFLLVFGKAINAWLGQVRFTLFYCCTGALAALAHAALQAHSLVPCVGASGAIAGVMGAYFVRHPLAQIRVLVGTRIVLVPAAAFLALWLFYQGAYAFASAGGSIAFGVAWYAHLGGFAAGALLALLTSGGQTEEETKMLKMQQ
ncbi:MAG TPA: rhomboid family intramembrane serine protease, partial [bacterium]|nr:rhomboid family intramembrane serine protease [bacterium]